VTVAVIIPTLGRPHRVAPIMENLAATAPGCVVYFVAEAGDADTIATVEQHPYARLVVNRRSPSYAGAVNTALEDTDKPLLFVGADDLAWHDGWLAPLLELISDFGMVGTNDLGNPEVAASTHATHFLVRRDYAVTGCVDEPGVLFHEGYTHNWVDREAVGTAKHRGEFTPCLASVVEHLHWAWDKATMDATYEKGRSQEPADAQLYLSRQHLWGGR
jgi:glycosyltransferase involved in cell wall biosynthesis